MQSGCLWLYTWAYVCKERIALRSSFLSSVHMSLTTLKSLEKSVFFNCYLLKVVGKKTLKPFSHLWKFTSCSLSNFRETSWNLICLLANLCYFYFENTRLEEESWGERKHWKCFWILYAGEIFSRVSFPPWNIIPSHGALWHGQRVCVCFNKNQLLRQEYVSVTYSLGT